MFHFEQMTEQYLHILIIYVVLLYQLQCQELMVLSQLVEIKKRLRKGDYYKDQFHCVRLLLFVQNYNEWLLDYLELVKIRRNDLRVFKSFSDISLIIRKGLRILIQACAAGLCGRGTIAGFSLCHFHTAVQSIRFREGQHQQLDPSREPV